MELTITLIPSVIATAFLVWQHDTRNLVFAGWAGVAAIACMTRIEQGGNYWLWNLATMLCVCAFAYYWKLINPRWPRSERKAMRELFAEQTAWQVIVSQKFWFTSTKERHRIEV